MSSPTSSFRTVMRGYDPAEVDAHISTLKEHARALREQIAEVEERLAAVTEPNFTHLGARVGQILSLAEEESAALRKATAKEVETKRTDAADAVRRLRKEADAYDVTTRREADEYAGHRREADVRRGHPPRSVEADQVRKQALDEAARITGAAQAEFDRITAEHQRAVADFEKDLAARRAAAEAQRVETERVERERTEEAHRQAIAIVEKAEAEAERVRLEAEREVAEIERRSDSINAQLTNVRRALANLTGESPKDEQGELFEASADRS